MSDGENTPAALPPSLLDRLIRFCLENKLVVALLVVLLVGWGIVVAPFDWDLKGLPRRPVPVDAIPDIGENQQIVFTEWAGRSPQDVEDQITYPLAASLLGLPGAKTVRSQSLFGFSSIYVIFQQNVDFHWARSRILEKLNSLPADTLPDGVQPRLGPEATALGQVFWYTLEGRDADGRPSGGWDPHELRTIQDWYLRSHLLSAPGVAEVASVGGFVQEYQIDVDPDAMRAYGVTLEEVFRAVQMSNSDIGARTIEINRVDYTIRSLGFIREVSDIENTVIEVNDNVPVYIRNVATVSLGPALRRGALDKDGAEAVGGVVVVRYGENPLAAIKAVKEVLSQLGRHGETKDGPYWQLSGHKKTLSDGRVSHVAVVPFYDRTGLIYETLGTLNRALTEEILVTIIVVVVLVLHLRSSILISGALPLAVLMCFIAMKLYGVDANIVALSGIAIAIGTIVDMGIIVCENVLKHLSEAPPHEDRLEVVFRATSEVGGAVLTAVSTTIVSFLPVFAMTGTEGKLFRPLAFTKTFALASSVIVALTVIPPAAHLLFTGPARLRRWKAASMAGLIVAGLVLGAAFQWYLLSGVLIGMGAWHLAAGRLPTPVRKAAPWLASGGAAVFVAVLLTRHWLPLGPEKGITRNLVFVGGLIGGLLLFFRLFQAAYVPALRWCLANKLAFLMIPGVLVLLGASAWLGGGKVFAFLPGETTLQAGMSRRFPGLGKEFMPPLDEGSFLYMPSTMPHASLGEALDVLRKQDMALRSIPEVDSVVGKIGRVESPLDPAPISMIETVINYKPEYITDKGGRRLRFRYDEARQEFIRDESGELVPDPKGLPYRQWRDHIKNPDDIWDEIKKAAWIPGTTPAPSLQPIAARLVMLQSGIKSRMAVKITGPDLDTLDQMGVQIERLLKEVPSVDPSLVIADRIVGKPYLEIGVDREATARYGIPIQRVQDAIEVAIGGRRLTTTVEGRERYPVRVRYMRELRDQIETLGRVLIPAPDGTQIPLEQLADVRYVRGPQAIKSEDGFLVGYVLFDMKPGHAEVSVVDECRDYLEQKINRGELELPEGVSFAFAGTYESQVRARGTLAVVLPLALLVIFLIIYLHFKSVATTMLAFSGIVVAWAGGFLLIWLYGQPWFLDFELFGTNMRELFQVHEIHLSVAVWVGFLALFGIASDDGVVIATYLDQSFASRTIKSIDDVREATVAGAARRIRPCLMTSATTILALLPVLTSTGRGSDVMVPMAIPSFGGMLVVMISVFVVPVLYCAIRELPVRAAARA